MQRTKLKKREFYKQSLVAACFVLNICFIQKTESAKKKISFCFFALFFITLADVRAHFHKLKCNFIFTNQQVSEMFSKPVNKMMPVKAFVENFVEDEKR